MFSGIGRSLIPILSPEYVVEETVKAIRVNQEVLCLPTIVYFLVMFKHILPTRSFLWAHRAIGAASTMKTFTGRNGKTPPGHNHHQQQSHQQQQHLLQNTEFEPHLSIKINDPHQIGITIPENGRPPMQLNQ